MESLVPSVILTVIFNFIWYTVEFFAMIAMIVHLLWRLGYIGSRRPREEALEEKQPSTLSQLGGFFKDATVVAKTLKEQIIAENDDEEETAKTKAKPKTSQPVKKK